LCVCVDLLKTGNICVMVKTEGDGHPPISRG
jgi:hypothetical protein